MAQDPQFLTERPQDNARLILVEIAEVRFDLPGEHRRSPARSLRPVATDLLGENQNWYPVSRLGVVQPFGHIRSRLEGPFKLIQRGSYSLWEIYRDEGL